MIRGAPSIDENPDAVNLEVFNSLLDEILSTHVFPQVENVQTLDLIIRSSRRFNHLADTNQAWQAMCDKYFPYLVRNFSEKYQQDPKKLFIEEVKYLSSIVFKPSFYLAAINGDTKIIEQSESYDDQTASILILVAQGNIALLDSPEVLPILTNLSYIHDGPIDFTKLMLSFRACNIAAFFGNKMVIEQLIIKIQALTTCISEQTGIQIPPERFFDFIFSIIRDALRNNNVELARELFEKYIPGNVDQLYLRKQWHECLSCIFGPFIITFDYKRTCFLSSLEFLCSVLEKSGSVVFSDIDIFQALRHTVENGGNLDILKKLLSLKIQSFSNPVFCSDHVFLLKGLLSRAEEHNHAQVFIYLFNTYKKTLSETLTSRANELVKAPFLEEYILFAAENPSQKYSPLAFIAEQKDAKGHYCIGVKALHWCMDSAVQCGNTEELNFLLNLKREGEYLKETINIEDLINNLGDNPQMLSLILQSTSFQKNSNTVYEALLKRMLVVFYKDPSQIPTFFSKVKDKEGKSLIEDSQLMMQTMLNLDIRYLNNEPIKGFIQGLSEPEFDKLKCNAKFFNRQDLVNFCDKVRTDMLLEEKPKPILRLSQRADSTTLSVSQVKIDGTSSAKKRKK